MTRREAEEIMRLLDEKGIKAAMTQDGTDIGVAVYPDQKPQEVFYEYDSASAFIERANE